MFKSALRITSIALLAGAAVAGSAQGRYLCDAPPTSRDARACEAAKESPTALRRFIQRMQGIEFMEFSDYVNDAQRLAWDAKEADDRIADQAEK